MNRCLVALQLVIITVTSHGQNANVLFADNNPKITLAESIWLNSNFKADNFDYKDKYIGFVDLQSSFYGIGKIPLTLLKKKLIGVKLKDVVYKLIVLDSIQRNETRRYDALLVIAKKNIAGKLNRLKIEDAMVFAKNRYPQIPTDAGIDTNSQLNIANAIFFNELYKVVLYPQTSFDFTGKKVAIFNSNCGLSNIERISIPTYVKRIKAQLDIWGSSTLDDTYYLTKEQKLESGGYDVIIDYNCKKGIPPSYLIKQLH